MSVPDAVPPARPAAHCLVCQAAALVGPSFASAVLAHGLTVEAARLYARLHYRAELDEHQHRP